MVGSKVSANVSAMEIPWAGAYAFLFSFLKLTMGGKSTYFGHPIHYVLPISRYYEQLGVIGRGARVAKGDGL